MSGALLGGNPDAYNQLEILDELTFDKFLE